MEPQEAPFAAVLVGKRCRRVLAQEHSYRGAVVSPWNVIFLELDDGGYVRFFFDCGDFFWRIEAPVMPPAFDDNSYRLTEPDALRNLGGREIARVDFGPTTRGDRALRLRFVDGAKLSFRNEDDASVICFADVGDT